MTAKSKRARKGVAAKKAAARGAPPRQQPPSQKRTSAGKPPPKKAGTAPAFFSFDNKRFVLLCLLAVLGFAFFVRCLHLFDSSHYYIISADSHVFHWMAGEIMDGQAIPDRFPSGLAYPMAYIASAVGFVFSLSDEHALELVTRYLAPFLAVITCVVLYVAASRLYDRRVGLMSAFAWAVLPHAYFIQGAGYVDRDPFNVLLVAIGAFVFVFSKRWHRQIGRLDVGWVLGALLVLVIEFILYLEWSWVGPGLVLAIILAYSAGDFVVEFLKQGESGSMARYQPESEHLSVRLKSALKQTSWQPLALVLSLNILVSLVNFGLTAKTFSFIGSVLAAGSGEIAELQGLGFSDLLLFQFFLLLIPVGLFLALMRHQKGDILVVTWFVSFFVLSLFSRRTILYATPAAAVLGGIVLGNLIDFRYSREAGRIVQKIVAVIVVGILLGLSSLAQSLGSEPRVAANNAWYDALVYLKDNTEEDAIVMTWWDYGYWILDVAGRRPVVDGGLYGHGGYQDDDIALVYCTEDASEAVQVMQKYKADYLVFSEVEHEIWPTILSRGWPQVKPGEDWTPLWRRALDGNFHSEDGLERIYPAPEVQDPEIVILALKEG